MNVKDKCRMLKELRKEIAAANGVPYVSHECAFKGQCSGACAQTDDEVRSLNELLMEKAANGETMMMSTLAMHDSLYYEGQIPGAHEAGGSVQRERERENRGVVIPRESVFRKIARKGVDILGSFSRKDDYFLDEGDEDDAAFDEKLASRRRSQDDEEELPVYRYAADSAGMSYEEADAQLEEIDESPTRVMVKLERLAREYLEKSGEEETDQDWFNDFDSRIDEVIEEAGEGVSTDITEDDSPAVRAAKEYMATSRLPEVGEQVYVEAQDPEEAVDVPADDTPKKPVSDTATGGIFGRGDFVFEHSGMDLFSDRIDIDEKKEEKAHKQEEPERKPAAGGTLAEILAQRSDQERQVNGDDYFDGSKEEQKTFFLNFDLSKDENFKEAAPAPAPEAAPEQDSDKDTIFSDEDVLWLRRRIQDEL